MNSVSIGPAQTHKKEMLPGLNGLRAIAASLVLFGHVYQITGLCGNREGDRLFYKYNVGSDMVNLFFVISGFIITYVLLNEKARYGNISLRNFYIKRALRIWPLYFLLLVIVALLGRFTICYSVLGFHRLHYGSIGLLSFFLVNLVPYFSIPLSVLPHYWSLSVEEQFYIFWPFLFKKLDPLKVAYSLVFIMIAAKLGTDYIAYHGGDKTFWSHAYNVVNISAFGSIAIGAILSVYMHRKAAWLNILYHPAIQVLCWALLAITIAARNAIPQIPFIQSEIMAVVYAVLIFNVTSNPKPLIRLEGRFLNYTGKISYGIYMYHWPVIPLLYLALKHTSFYDYFMGWNMIPFIAVSYIVVYGIAAFSFKYFESPLLRLRPSRKSQIKQKSYIA